ncbi:PspC domain-containing protein [Sporosarcina sp. P12(2017)]|uniref:PspC domain-containing protein n=1 Tax=unclassified Sporosarcina TaxID=2647733 RepID=UPI000C173253|nr:MULTISPECIES: PspC domain-containing protein [unclassified Sporosarcina]PIC57966.1 PspC domain-containing protein [Sporosarcina sp. P10]PIC61349.1 PspC domain-containing protein [Sporosarcina sp. P12(2017)]
MQNKLKKSSRDKIISGVCGGIAEYFGISSLAVRIIFFILPASLLVYLVLAYFLPFEDLSL